MKKEQRVQRRASAAPKNSAIKDFLKAPPSLLAVQPIYVLILSLFFIGNILFLHIVSRFGAFVGFQVLIACAVVLFSLFLGYATHR